MSLIQGKFIEDGAVTGAKIKLDNNQTLKGRNAADNADVDILKVNTSDQIELASDAYVGANKVQTAADKGVANGIAELDGSGKVPTAQLPSYVDDVLEYADLASFPVTGETGKIYVAIDTGKTYRWSGSAYVEISASEVNSVNGATGVVVLDTDDISEGAVNLYYSDALVRSATLDGYSVGANVALASTDTVLGAFEKVQGQINALAAANQSFGNETITLTGTDITNGYIDLAQTPIAESLHVTPKGGLLQDQGTDYTLSTNRITFTGDLATVLAAGDILLIKYAY